MDQIAAMVSRLFPNPDTDSQRAGIRKSVRAFIHNHPDLATVFYGSDEERQGVPYRDGSTAFVLNVENHERLQRSMTHFAARVGFALFHRVNGRPVPSDAAVVARWYSNYELDHNEEINTLLQAMGTPFTLVMGKRNVQEQFRYWVANVSDDERFTGCFAAFRESFGTLAIVNIDGSDVLDGPNTFRAGFLKGFVV
jgi:hypothetical protein